MFSDFVPQFSANNLQSAEGLQRLSRCWQTGQSGFFRGQQQCQLHFRYWLTPGATAALVIVPGRIESAHKYLEVVADALAAGYQVFVLDHRGQGLSDRLCDDPQIGLVLDFAHYVEDLALWFTEIQHLTSLPMLALAHSMGGAILMRYLQSTSAPIPQAAIFCSPMWGIRTGALPAKAAQLLAQLVSSLNNQCSRTYWYGPHQGPYVAKPFAGNDLTTCEVRYQWFRTLYASHTEYQVGGASWTWLACAFNACATIAQASSPTIPCLLLQAGADRVVDNQAQSTLWQRWRCGPSVCIDQAAHELLCANDAQRQQVYQAINQFLRSLGTLS